MAGPSTGALIDNMSYSHKAMADLILENPAISQGELARAFGYTEGWISQVVRSDSFTQYLASRQAELTDPALRATLEERLSALAHRSIDILLDKLDATSSPDVALKALELTTRSKGYGAGINIQNNTFVVAMPQKATSGAEWSQEHKPAARLAADAARFSLDTVIDVQPSQ